MNERVPPNWSEFRAREPRVTDEVAESFALLHARLFTTTDGREWLARMREAKFGASLDPNISESALRHMEGQRQLIRDIDRLTEHGLSVIRAAKK